MWLFNNAMRQKEIHSILIYGKHQFSNYESHIINISRDFHLHYSPQHILVSLNGQVAELLWALGVFLAVTTAGINLSRKCDVTKWQSRPWLVTRGRSVLVESFVTSSAINFSPSHFVVLDVVLNCLDIWTLRISACDLHRPVHPFQNKLMTFGTYSNICHDMLIVLHHI